MTDLSRKGRELRGNRGKIHIFNGHPSEIWEIWVKSLHFFPLITPPHPHQAGRLSLYGLFSKDAD